MPSEAPGVNVDGVHVWLESFAACVRARDFEGGRALFAPQVHGFGTLTPVVEDRQALHDWQWLPTWVRTREFRFEPATVRLLTSPDGCQAVVMAMWSSEGVDRPDHWGLQPPYARRGRATIVLRRQLDGSWLAFHTHFSLIPNHGEGR